MGNSVVVYEFGRMADDTFGFARRSLYIHLSICMGCRTTNTEAQKLSRQVLVRLDHRNPLSPDSRPHCIRPSLERIQNRPTSAVKRSD